MKKNLLFYLMIVLLINCGLKANPVKKSYAGKIAKNFYYAHTSFGYDEIEFPNYFTTDFEENKRLLEKVATFHSKKLRNQVAGYIVHLLKKQQKLLGQG